MFEGLLPATFVGVGTRTWERSGARGMRSSKRDAAGVFCRSRELFEQVVAGWRTPAMPRPPPHMVAGQLRTGTIRALQKSRTRLISARRAGPAAGRHPGGSPPATARAPV